MNTANETPNLDSIAGIQAHLHNLRDYSAMKVKKLSISQSFQRQEVCYEIINNRRKRAYFPPNFLYPNGQQPK